MYDKNKIDDDAEREGRAIKHQNLNLNRKTKHAKRERTNYSKVTFDKLFK